MGRTRLRGIELAGIRIAVEVPASEPWDWGACEHERFACPPADPDVYVGVRRARTLDVPAQSIVYACEGGTFEVARAGEDWVVAVHGRERFERVARFDESFSQGEVCCRQDIGFLTHPLAHPLDELILLHRIAREGGMVLRGSAVYREGHALVFVGDRDRPAEAADARCGWKQARGPGGLAGDRVVVRAHESGVRVHGTPWQRISASPDSETPLRARLDAVHVLHDSDAVFAERLEEEAAHAALLAYAFAPVHDPDGALRLAPVAEQIARSVPVLRLGLPSQERVVPFTWGQRQAALAFAPPFVH